MGNWKSLPYALIIPGLQGLEERFLGLIEPKLAAALSQKNGERVQQLSGMLLGIQCYGTVEKLYNTARMAPLQVFHVHCITYSLGCGASCDSSDILA
jgi:hypothetical protein